jgi:hypothetical protein
VRCCGVRSPVFKQFGGFFSIISVAFAIKGLIGIWLYATAGGISPNHAYHTHLLRPHVLVFEALFILAVARWLAVTCCVGPATHVEDDKPESDTQFSAAIRQQLLSNTDYDYDMDQFEEEEDFEKAFGEALLRRARAPADGGMPDSVYRAVVESVWDGKDLAKDRVCEELAAAGKSFE